MKLVTTFAMALAIGCIMSWTSNSHAQTAVGHSFPYPGVQQAPRASLRAPIGHFPRRRGLNFGAGWWYYQLQNVNGIPRHEEPPYFAKFPPVYYNGIVRRPYGISPFAVPAGTIPVEMQVAPKPKTVLNPYYEATPVDTDDSKAPKREDANKVTWQVNPHQAVLADDR